MEKETALAVLGKLESKLFEALFNRNRQKIKEIIKKEESIIKSSKAADWLLSDIKTLLLSKSILKKLKDKEIFTIYDLLNIKPLRVENYSLVNPKEIKNSRFCAVKGTVLSKENKKRVFTLILDSNGLHIRCFWFNLTPYLKKMLSSIKVGDIVVCSGKLQVDGFIKQFHHPRIEKEENFKESLKIVYPSIGIRNSNLQNIIEKALQSAPKEPFEYLPYNIILKNKIVMLNEFYKKLHTKGETEEITHRFKYEELFFLILALELQKKRVKTQKAPIISIDENFLEQIEENLPFELTKDQKKAINEILSDLKKDKPMLRLLQGDVGCGKTIVALISGLAALKNGYQIAIMTPTQPLASQFFQQAKNLYEKYGFSVEILLSHTKNKKEIYNRLKDGKIDCIVGTHALIQDEVNFKNLGFIVIDEQHRFGVEQRKNLSNKGLFPHTLIMSATPIPRTLSMILYSNGELSTIREKPAGRKEIKNLHFFKRDREKAYKIAIEEIKKSHQVYVIAPLIEESEHFENLKAAEDLFNELKNGYLKGTRIALLHGKLPPQEKEEIINDFKNGKIDCLVSTTVIEVGIDSPNATVIIIENAERFGLSQLHQLRGRIGRSNLESFAIFITDENLSENACKRIDAILKTNDGFEIAKLDLKLRGTGEILGTRQHGKDLIYTDILKDIELIKKVKSDVEFLIKKNYPLNEGLIKMLKYKWEERLNYIKVV